jgi:ATP-dependent helicase/nuclease subunit A
VSVERDRSARLLAQTVFDRPLVLEAGAGTGKTTTLVARVVAWCLGPGWERAASDDADPDAVARRVLGGLVAITFTEAATAEMSRRVGDALREIAAGALPRGVEPEALLVAGESRAERAGALLRALDQLGVRTIHAFCRRILAEHALEAGLHPHFVVDADESRSEAVTRQVVEESLEEICEGDDGLALARAGVGPRELAQTLLQLVRDGVPASAFGEDPLSPARCEAVRQELAAALDGFVAAGGEAVTASRARKQAAAAESLVNFAAWLPGEGQLDPPALREAVAGALDADPSVVQQWLRKGPPKTATLADPDAFVQAAADLHPILFHVSRLDLESLRAGWRLLGTLLARVEQRLRAEGVETFAGLLRGARDLLRDQPAVVARLRGQIEQLLVDEFQDTDALQCEILRRLVLAAPEAERPGLFLVGDPKQSIYGWRNADLAAYEEFTRAVVAAGGRVEPLVVNHRSAQPVLAEVEQLVAPVMRAEPGLQPAFEPLIPAEAGRRDPGFREDGCAPVEHWVSWGWGDDGPIPNTLAGEAARIEAAAVAADARRLHDAGHVAWREVALLFRSGTDWETYLEALREAGVPFAVEGDRSYYERREVLEAAAFLRCVVDPNDMLALVSWLRSALVGVPDAALVPLWAEQLPDVARGLDGEADPDELDALVARAASRVPEGVPGLDRLAGWTDSLRAGLRALGRLRRAFEDEPADAFVERLRTCLAIEPSEAARYLGPYRVANLERFFRDLLAALAGGDADPQAVIRTLREDVAERREHEEGRPREAVEDAVQVLTIHKAKGLDFEHVYLLQAHKGHGNREAEGADFREGELELNLSGVRSLLWHRAARRRAQVEEAERRRTWYVALTRAKRRLVVAGRWPDGSRSSQGFAPLLAERREGAPELAEAMRACAAEGSSVCEHAGVRFAFPALRTPDPEPRAGVGSAPRARLPSSAELLAGAQRLAEQRELAVRRAGRSLGAPVSRAAHEADVRARRDAQPAGGDPDTERATATPLRRDTATAVGTAVHRVLEQLDLSAEPEAELRRCSSDLEESLARAVPVEERGAALARAGGVLQRFASGPLLPRLRGLEPHILARELPVLLRPDEDAPEEPVGFLAGVVDLLYRDPESGEWVVADYKTDRIASDEDLRARCDRYAAQGAGYVRAVRDAMALDVAPRFELWFLDRDLVHRS